MESTVTMLQRHSQLGNYEIMELLGEGGMSLVYKARGINGGTPVAIKIPDRQLLTSPGALRQFSREGNALVRLRHPNIVKVHSCGAQNGLPYIVMEYVDGSPLTEEIRARRPFPVEKVAHLLFPIGQALDYIHAQDIVHRDVKPGNIRLTRAGAPILVDFGIVQTGEATVWDDGKPRGSVWYMSPEQASGQRASGFSDQYSLAVVAYEMLAGRVPFDGENPYAIVLQQRDANAPMPSGWSLPVKAVMERALDKDPNARFSSCTDFIEALRRAAEGHLPLPPSLTVTADQRFSPAVARTLHPPAATKRAHSVSASSSTAPRERLTGWSFSAVMILVAVAFGLALVAATGYWLIHLRSSNQNATNAVVQQNTQAFEGEAREKEAPATGQPPATPPALVPLEKATASLSVKPAIVEFVADSAGVKAGQEVRLRWAVTGDVRKAWLTPGGLVPDNATGFVVHPTATTVYKLTAKGANATVEKTLKVDVVPFTPPVITQFTGEPKIIGRTEIASLTWTVGGDVTKINLTPGPPISSERGTVEVTPQKTTEYTLEATGPAGTASKSVTIEVSSRAETKPLSDTQPTTISTDSGDEAKRIYAEAQSQLAARKYEEAVALFGRAARLKPGWSQPLIERAKLDAKLGRYTEAIEDSTQALRLDPNDAVAFNFRGYARYSMNHFEEAIADFNEAIRLKPDYHDAYLNRGNAKWAGGDKQGANIDFSFARSLQKKR